MKSEARFSMLWKTHPEYADTLAQQAQHEVTQRYHFFKQLSEMNWDEGSGLAVIKEKMKKH
jgi:pyruvate-ferredoxin/flavodoxin oxidoreductase